MKKRIAKKIEKKKLDHYENQVMTLKGLIKRQAKRIARLSTEIAQEQKVLSAVLEKVGREITITGDDVASAPLFVVKHSVKDKNDLRKSEYTFVRAEKDKKAEEKDKKCPEEVDT